MWRWSLSLCTAASMALGCGGDDGGVDDDPVAPPVFTPCPTGWREVPPADVDDVATCDPWPAGGRQVCAADEAHFPGEPGCVRIGSACPAGDFPEDLPGGVTIRYVRPGAAGGDGTTALPFGSVTAAMAAAAPGTILALAKGTYDEDVQLAAGVTLWGACVASTVVGRTTYDPLRGTLNVAAPDVVVRNLGIAGARTGVWATGAGAAVQLTDVVVAGAADVGVYTELGAAVVLRTVAIRDTRRSPAGLYGDGIQVWMGASLDAGRLVVERNVSAALSSLAPGSTALLADAAFVDTQPDDQDAIGAGLNLDGGDVDGARIAVEGSAGVAVWVANDASLTLADAVIRDTHSRLATPGEAEGGRGLNLIKSGHAALVRTLVERNREAALFVLTDAVLTLEDVVVRDTGPQETSGEFGRGLWTQYGAQATVTRAIFRRNRDVAVFASAGSGGGAGASVQLVDVAVLDTLAQECEAAGTCRWNVSSGLGAYTNGGASSGHITAERFRVARSAFIGVQVADDGAIDLHDGTIEDNTIGINLQIDGYDATRLNDRVRLIGNGVNLAADQLPIPGGQ